VLREDAVVVGSSLTLAAIEESWRVITVVLREDVVTHSKKCSGKSTL